MQSPYLKGTAFAKHFRVSRSAAFDCHESQIYRDTATFVDPSSGRYWGKPPALVPPGHKGKGKGGRIVLAAPEESICDTIDHSNLRGILRDLCYWQSHVTTVEELAGKVTSADWYPLLLGKLAESVIVISGAPNVGKSSLAVHLAKTLGLMRTKTTSRNFWLFARSERPYFSLWVYCTDSFWSEQEPSWSRMRQSVSSITSSEEFATGAAILEGHRVLLFRAMPTWPPLWFTWPLPTSSCLSEGRKLGQFESISFSCRTP